MKRDGPSRDYVARFKADQGLISWDAADLQQCQLDARFARILHVAALLEEDTEITVRQGASLGLEELPSVPRAAVAAKGMETASD